MAFGHPDAQVELVDPLHIHIELPGGAVDQFDAGLGQAAGGFELRPVLEDLSDCSTGGSNPDGSFTARTSGPNGSCYRLGPAVDLGPAGAVGRSVSSPPPVLQLSLTDAAVSAALDVQQECVRHAPQCPTGMVALTSMLSIVDLDVSVASAPSAGGSTPGARVSVRGFSTDREAEYQAILLSIPLPAGVLFQGSPSTYSSTIVPTSDLSAGAEMSSVRVLCLSDAVDATLFASIRTVLEARFASIGRTVRVAPYLALPGVPAAGCISGQSLTLASNYDSGDPSWAGDQISMLRGPGIVAEEVDPRRLATLLANPLPAGVSFQQ